jgi:adenylate cyclase
MFRTIGTKIFTIAVGLLAMMVVASLISSILTARVHRELKTVSEGLLPLAISLGDFRTATLATRMTINARQRDLLDPAACRALATDRTNEAARLIAEAERLRSTGARLALLDRNVLMLTRLEPLIGQLSSDADKVRILTFRQCEAQIGSPADAELEREARDTSDDLQRETTSLTNQLSAFVEEGSALVLRDQSNAQRATLALIGIAALVGLTLAWMVARSLSRPIKMLREGAHAVQAGQLDAHVPVTSRDEIGDVTVAFNEMVLGLRSKEQIRETFGRYVDPRIVSQLLDERTDTIGAGEKKVATVYFSDLAGFTTIAERLAPNTVVALINAYFAEMAVPIHERTGIIDKFIGDGLMAFWVPPFSNADDQTALACATALEQRRRLQEFQARVPDIVGLRRDVPTLEMRIGLATGDVVVGSIGSLSARSFTVMGDTVNFSSRLEGANKAYGTRIMIDEQTWASAGDRIVARELDSLAVVGRHEPVRVFELLGMAGEVAEAELEAVDIYAQGLAKYRAGEWKAAEALFLRVLALRLHDSPSKVMIERIGRFLQAPPATWDGVWRLTSK